MKRILIFGAGKSSTCLVDYLRKFLQANNWWVVIADANLAAAESKVQGMSNSEAISLDVTDEEQRKN